MHRTRTLATTPMVMITTVTDFERGGSFLSTAREMIKSQIPRLLSAAGTDKLQARASRWGTTGQDTGRDGFYLKVKKSSSPAKSLRGTIKNMVTAVAETHPPEGQLRKSQGCVLPPYSVAPCDFRLLPEVKMTMKGKHFKSVQDTEAITTAQIKDIHTKTSSEWDKCVQTERVF